VDSIRNLVVAIAAGWGVEHTAEGRHDWHWTDLAFDSTRFSADTGSWSVAQQDQVQLQYGLLGDLMSYHWRINTSDVGGTPGYLRLALPTGYSATVFSHGVHSYNDAGGASTLGPAQVYAGDRFVRLYKAATAAWTTTTADDTYSYGSIQCRVTKD